MRKQLLVLVLRLCLVLQNIFHIIFCYVRKQSRWQAIVSPSHLKHSELFPGTTLCWLCRSAFEMTWSVELCHISLWKMTSLGFCHSFLGKMCSVSQAETAPGFAVCLENLYGLTVTQLFISSRARPHVRNCPVTTPRVISSVRNIVLGVAPILSICWYWIVLGLL